MEWLTTLNFRLFFPLSGWLYVSNLRNLCLFLTCKMEAFSISQRRVRVWWLKITALKSLSQGFVYSSSQVNSDYSISTSFSSVIIVQRNPHTTFFSIIWLKRTTFIFLNGIWLQESSCRAITPFMIILYKIAWRIAQYKLKKWSGFDN